MSDKRRGCDRDDDPQWDALYSIHYVFICIRDVFDPFPACLFKTVPSLSPYSFFGPNISVPNGGGAEWDISVDLHNLMALLVSTQWFVPSAKR